MKVFNNTKVNYHAKYVHHDEGWHTYVLVFHPSQKLGKGTKLKLMDTLIQHDHCTPRTVQGSKNIIQNFVPCHFTLTTIYSIFIQHS